MRIKFLRFGAAALPFPGCGEQQQQQQLISEPLLCRDINTTMTFTKGLLLALLSASAADTGLAFARCECGVS